MSECHTCGQESKFKCGHCNAFEFCSHECSDVLADVHNKVCFDARNKDVEYVKEHLREAIVDMQSDKTGMYTQDEIDDAIDVLVDSEFDVNEAHEIIGDHLTDIAGQFAFDSMPEGEQQELLGEHFNDYGAYHRYHIGFGRLVGEEPQVKEDRAAARKALRAAEWERRAAAQRGRGDKIMTAGEKRAEKRRLRGVRRQKRKEKAATRKERRAERLRRKAAVDRARGAVQKDRAERFANRTKRFAGWRKGLADKGAKRKEARAAKYRGGARKDLAVDDAPSSGEE